MRYTLGALSVAALASAQAPSINDYSQQDIADGTAFKNISDISITNSYFLLEHRQEACTFENAEVRVEWYVPLILCIGQ